MTYAMETAAMLGLNLRHTFSESNKTPDLSSKIENVIQALTNKFPDIANVMIHDKGILTYRGGRPSLFQDIDQTGTHKYQTYAISYGINNPGLSNSKTTELVRKVEQAALDAMKNAFGRNIKVRTSPEEGSWRTLKQDAPQTPEHI